MAITKEKANQLFNFIETDATEKAIAILEEKVDFSVSKNGYNLIHLAARKGMKDIVEKLIRKGMSVNSTNENGNSALHYAAREGHLEVVELLINNGADPNICNQEGSTALHIAVKFHPMYMIDRFIALGMKVNHTNSKGETPLHIAVMHNRQEAMEALLVNGANPFLEDNTGKRPESHAKDPELARQIRSYRDLAVAMQSGYIFAEEIQICLKTPKMPFLMSRVGVVISKLDTPVDQPILFYCRREKPENCSIKFSMEKADEIVSDIFLIRVNDNLHKVKLQIKIPLYAKISNKEEIIVKFTDEAANEYEETEEHGDITYCPLQLDMNPGSKKEMVVLSRPKKEEYTVGTEGSSIRSKIEENFVIDIPTGTFDNSTKITMRVYETSESQQFAKEGTKMPGKNADKGRSANPVLLTDIFQISTEGKQPTKKVTVQIPFCEDKIKMSDEIVIVAADENKLVDEKSLESISTKPKRHKGNIIFEVKHFSIYVAVPSISIKTSSHLREIVNWIIASRDRKKPCVFFCMMMQTVANDGHRAIVECTTSENSPKRRQFWEDLGYVEQDMAESETFMMEPSQEFQVIFSGNIKVLGDTGHRRLTFLPKGTSFLPYNTGLKEDQKAAVGVIQVLRILREGNDSPKTDVRVTSLPIKVENIRKRRSTESINIEPRFMILKPESLKVLGQALTRTQGKQLGNELGLDPKTMRRIRLESPNSGYANFKIIETWINITTDWWKNVSTTTESTLINALNAIGMQPLADVFIRVKEKERVLREEDFRDSKLNKNVNTI